MRRLAAILLCLCTSLLLASSAHAARATIGPGVALVFTSGWQVCNSGAALRYALPGIQRSECGMFAPNAMAMHYMASGRPIDLWISHVDNPMASETMWKGASPDEVRKVSDELCAKARSQRTTDVGSCRWALGTIAGHTVFRQRGTVTQVGDPLKMQMEVNGFSVADGSGYTTIVATTPMMVHGKTDPIIAALQASLLVATAAPGDAPPPAPPSPDQMVSLTPAPGLHIQIPRDWIACDDKTEALLTSARDSMKVKDKVCAPMPGGEPDLHAFAQRPLHVISLALNYHRHQDITPEALADMSQSDLDTLRSGICAQESVPLSAPMADCRITVGTLAGHRALVSTIVSTLPDGGKWLIVSYEVPYAAGFFQLQFGHAEIVEKVVRPELDAILATVQIDDAPSPSPDGDTKSA